MFKSAGAQGELNGILDAGSQIQGELYFEDTFRVDGKVLGKVVSKGNLIVGENGDIDGEIRVRRAIVSGTVKGQVYASEKVEITTVGKVFADLFTPTLVIEEGAFFEGSCSMKTQQAGAEQQKVARLAVAKES